LNNANAAAAFKVTKVLATATGFIRRIEELTIPAAAKQ
jgi:hypothetical protein